MKTNRNSKIILWLFGGYILSTLLMLLATPLTKALGITASDNAFTLTEIALKEAEQYGAARAITGGSTPPRQNDDGRSGNRAAADYGTFLCAARVQNPFFSDFATNGTLFGTELNRFWRPSVGT